MKPNHNDVILDAMESGESLRNACLIVGTTPQSFLRMVDKDATLAEQYIRARARMLDVHAEDLETLGERAAASDSAVEVAGLRLQSDNRKWLLSKLAPKKYGEKLAIGGAADLPAIQGVFGMTTEALLAIASQSVVTKTEDS